MSKKLHEKRAELFKKSAVQIFLSKFLSGEIERLEPEYDPKIGYHYPLLESILDVLSAGLLILKRALSWSIFDAAT
ncbi:hypothetical protein B6U79_04900 [Candidatus Bathyarchaeota archaeon ex4484_231]|nr:MAG: hypothetical protein B6U79_04900 [Candidatus Bathyarchaeota archaeon ex4484_231]